jgi:transcriptional antiterminator
MYIINKVLNNNSILSIRVGTEEEYLIIGKGIGFHRKKGESYKPGDRDTIYRLLKCNKNP